MNFLSSLYDWIHIPHTVMNAVCQGLRQDGDVDKLWPFVLVMILISMLVAFCYYYIINHPKFNRWQHWLTMLAVNFVINFLVSGIWIYKYATNPNDIDILNAADITVTPLECFLGFGLDNGIWSIIFFIITSFIIKWWSSNCKYSPF
jgi:hypothetical protein